MTLLQLLVFIGVIFGPVLLYASIRLASNAYFAAKLDYQRKLIEGITPATPEEKKE